jgi:O-6-methylguanine DNA methyltransferase
MGFADFPFQSRYQTVDGQRIHYIDEGDGPVLLFIHGNPTSSYLWRNIIKPLRTHYRCIALDLIGFGQSDKPELDYRFQTHYRFLLGFVEALDLRDMTLVLHDWGGPLGFQLAQQQPDRVARICFMETFPFTFDWSTFPPGAKQLFQGFRHPKLGPALVIWQNLFVNLVLPLSVKRHLPRSVMQAYRAPFRKREHRKPILLWPNELPLDDDRGKTWEAIKAIENNLGTMTQPMLLLAFKPGAIVGKTNRRRLEKLIPGLAVKDCGVGLHYVQEDQPEAIANAISDWLAESTGTEAGKQTGVSARVAESDKPGDTLHWRTLSRDKDQLVAAWDKQGLVALEFLDKKNPETVLGERFPNVSLKQESADKTDWLSPDTPLHLVGTEFQRQVWKALLAIPAGETRSYKDIAEAVGSQPRAVGQAVGKNNIALRVPCHRVLPVSGGTGGYKWGKARKEKLLKGERG